MTGSPANPSWAVLLAFALAGCPGPAAPGPAPVEATCRVTLPARAAPAGASDPAPPAASAFVAERSVVVTHVELPLAAVKHGLETKIGKRVAEERDHDIGVAGRLEYTVDRGPFGVSVQGDALVVDAPLDAHVRACAKGQCYAGCDPQMHASARVSLRLGADYKFRPSQVRIDVVRGCEVRALGGFLKVDVTPILQSRLAAESHAIEAQIDRELPDMRPEAARLWTELGRSHALPLGACVVAAPEAILQGAPAGTPDAARLRLALVAHPELRVRCSEQPPAAKTPPLPPLRDDPGLAPEGDVHLAVVLPPDSPASAAAGSPEIVELGKARSRMARASGTAGALAIELSGEACGEAGVHATGAAWDPSGHAIRLAGAAPLAGEAERFAPLGLDPSGVARAVERTPIAVPIAADELRTLVPELARAMSDDHVGVTATVREAHPGAAGLRGIEPVAVVVLRGAVTIRAK